MATSTEGVGAPEGLDAPRQWPNPPPGWHFWIDDVTGRPVRNPTAGPPRYKRKTVLICGSVIGLLMVAGIAGGGASERESASAPFPSGHDASSAEADADADADEFPAAEDAKTAELEKAAEKATAEQAAAEQAAEQSAAVHGPAVAVRSAPVLPAAPHLRARHVAGAAGSCRRTPGRAPRGCSTQRAVSP